MAETRMQKYERFKTLTGATVRSSAMTLAQYGMDPDNFAEVVCEALLSNPDIMDCTEESIAKALRGACQDGLIPNGREAAITAFRDRQKGTMQATYLPMKEGMARLAWEALQAELHTGIIREGDAVKVSQGAGIFQSIEIGRNPFREIEGEVKGCYLWCHLPFEKFPRLILWRKEDIDRRRAASFASENGPWNKWYAEKAQTSIAKHFLTSIRHLITSSRKSGQLLAVVEADTQREIGTGEPVAALPAHEEEAVDTQTGEVTAAQAEPVREMVPVDDIPEPALPRGNTETMTTGAAGQAQSEQGTFLPKDPPANGESATDL